MCKFMDALEGCVAGKLDKYSDFVNVKVANWKADVPGMETVLIST